MFLTGSVVPGAGMSHRLFRPLPPLFLPPQFHPYQPSCSILGNFFISFGKELQAGLQVAHRLALVLQQM